MSNPGDARGAGGLVAATPTRPGPRAAVQIDRSEIEGFQAAARLLLAHPLVTETWPRAGALATIRRWEVPLRNEMGRVLGFRLDIGRSCARLYRKAAVTSVHRGPVTRTDRSLGRVSCSFLCLALAALEGLGDQTTASRLSDEVLRLRAGDEALPVDLTRYDQRKAFVDAVKWLEDRGVLRLCDGGVDRWLADDATGDALYDVDRDAVSRLLVASPSILRDVRDAADFLVDPYAPTEDAQRNRVRHRIGRRLVSEPVVAYEDLDPDERTHVRQRRSRLVADVEQLTGCTVEARAEGLVLVDASVEPISAQEFPAGGTEVQAALLWGAALVDSAAVSTPTEAVGSARFPADADHAAAGGRRAADAPTPALTATGALDDAAPVRSADDGTPPPPASTAVIDAAVAAAAWDAVVASYGARFRVEFRDAPDRLHREVVALLDRFGLASVGGDGSVAVSAALARYRPAPGRGEDDDGAHDAAHDAQLSWLGGGDGGA